MTRAVPDEARPDAERAPSPRALELAYRYLNRRERTVAEVRKHLINREIEPSRADAVIVELIEQGALDDERFARLFVEDKRTLEQWGTERIRRGLLDRGIDEQSARAAASIDESESELNRALAVLRERFAHAPSDRRGRDRALGVLLRKGYDSELAVDALAEFSRGPLG